MSDLAANVLLRYLELGLLLPFTLLAWRMVRRGRDARSSTASRIGQGLLALSLFAPLAAWLAMPLQLAWRTTSGPALGASLPGTDAVVSGGSTGFTLLPWGQSMLPWGWIDAGVIALSALLAAGFATGAVSLGGRVLRLRGLVKRAVTLRRIGRVSVLVSDEISVPFSTIVLGRAHVILPGRLLDHPGDMNVSVRHELHHHRRRDTAWAVGLDALEALFFWNPAASAWSRELAEWQELACDQELVERGLSPRAYAECLLRVARSASTTNPNLVAVTAMASSASGGVGLRRRIEMLVDVNDRPIQRKRTVAATCTAVALVFAIALVAEAGWPSSLLADGADGGGAIGLPVLATPAAPALPATPATPPTPATPATSAPEAPMAPDIEFVTPEGESVWLSDLKGKVVVIDFWANWCRPCGSAAAHLKEFEKAFDSSDFQIVGVSLDDNEAAFSSFVERHGLTWPQHFDTEGWTGNVGRDYSVRVLPFHVVVDREGRIVRRSIGAEGLEGFVSLLVHGVPTTL